MSRKFLIYQLNTLQEKFISDNKRPKIKHSTLIAENCDGGYKDVDIEKKIDSLKIKWVTRRLDENTAPGKLFQIFSFQVILHHNLQLSYQCVLKTNNHPNFYQELVQTWADVSEKEPCNECSWNNSIESITLNRERLYNCKTYPQSSRHHWSKGVTFTSVWCSKKIFDEQLLIPQLASSHKNISKKWRSILFSGHIELLGTENNGSTTKKMSYCNTSRIRISVQKLVKAIVIR